MNEIFIRLVAALAAPSDNDPTTDDYARWTEILKAIFRLRDVQAHAFLTAINISGLPNESPSALLQRAHAHAKELLPRLLVEYREAKAKAATETNHSKYLRREADNDPFIDGACLTRDAYAGRGEMEPEQLEKIDAWGNIVRS
jgi:hypothetical protein